MALFTREINNWNDWGDTFQSISAFTPLIEQIFRKENLPMAVVENLTPGTNAVFKVGSYVIKIFIPISGGKLWNYGTNVNVELFGIRLANALEIPAPKLIADGVIEDKYHFRYMIMEYIHGRLFTQIEDSLTYKQKITIGRNARNITDKLNVPCENFTPIDVIIELCLKWLPVHAWTHGMDILKPTSEITSLNLMRELFRKLIEEKNCSE